MRGLAAIAILTAAMTAMTATTARADALADAEAKLAAGDWVGAGELAQPITHDPTAAPADQAEAFRVLGLSLFFQNEKDAAEAAFVSYLRMQPDAHLDPALVAPDAVVFFDAVRSRHAGELVLARPHPHVKHVWALNLLPPFGQFQNGDRALGWITGGVEVAALATNIATYAALRARCDEHTLVCGDKRTADTLRTVNLVSGGVFIAAFAFGIIQGAARYEPFGERITFAAVPTTGGFVVSVGWRR
jgi:hypothetical protein